MNAAKIIGHSYDAGIYCLDCSVYDAELVCEPEDDEGNPVHPIFAGSEDAGSFCDDCGVNLLTGEVSDSKEECTHRTIDFAQAESNYNGIMIHVTCRICGVSGSYPIDPDDINWPDKEG